MAAPIIHILAGDLWGGREAQLEVQLAALRSSGCEVLALLFNEGEVSRRYRELDIPVEIRPEAYGVPFLLREARRLVEEYGAKVVVGHGYKEAVVAAWATFRKADFIVQFHGASESYGGFSGVKIKIYELIAKFLARGFAGKIICVSRALGDTLGFSKNPKLRIVFNAATLGAGNAKQGEAPDLFLRHPAIVTIGRLVPVKRVDLAIDALNVLKSQGESSAVLYVIGAGQELERLQALSETLGVASDVEFCGFRSDVMRQLPGADILLISSDSEGIPTVLLDALQLGKPIVSTAVGGIPEVMEFFPDYPVQLVEKNSATALAKGIADALHDRREASPARHEVLRSLFSAEAAARKHKEIYAEMLKARDD